MSPMNAGIHRPWNVRLSLTIIAAIAAVLALLALAMYQAPGAAAADPVTVNVALQDHTNDYLDILGNGSASYYSGGWHAITTQNVNDHRLVQVQLEPGTYTFAVVYNGTRDQKTVTINATPSAQTVYFHAALVRVALQGHTNDFLDIPNDGSASYYAGGWHSITDLDPNDHRVVQAEMLPGTYTFAVTYNGTRDQKTFTVIEPNPNSGANAVQGVYFHAALVNVELQGHDNDALDIPHNGAASYYAGGWHAITGVNPNDHRLVQTEMLPGTYTFAVTYNGTRDQKTYTVIEPNPNNGADAVQGVYFHAALVIVELQAHDSSALDIPNNGSASYYAGGWHAISTLNWNNPKMVVAEMLPGKYTFAVTYNGTRAQKTYTVIEPNPNDHEHATQIVYFHTVQVISDSGNATSYYAGGWQSFSSGDELLPGTYTFHFSDDTHNMPVTLMPGDGTVHIH